MASPPQKTKDVLGRWPIGSKIYLPVDFVQKACGLYRPDTAPIRDMKWEILDYYYIIGSRGSKIAAFVVGVPYEDWKDMKPKQKFVFNL